jgi:hypothetical protein
MACSNSMAMGRVKAVEHKAVEHMLHARLVCTPNPRSVKMVVSHARLV